MSEPTTLAVVKLDGELDIARRAEMRAALAVEGEPAGVLVDFGGVTYADSSAISELLRFRGELNRRGLPVALLIKSPQFKRLLEYAGVSDAFAVFDERAAALTYLGNADS
jgi:anti-anti-sigma factor